jgi:hypothetical protein
MVFPFEATAMPVCLILKSVTLDWKSGQDYEMRVYRYRSRSLANRSLLRPKMRSVSGFANLSSFLAERSR